MPAAKANLWFTDFISLQSAVSLSISCNLYFGTFAPVLDEFLHRSQKIIVLFTHLSIGFEELVRTKKNIVENGRPWVPNSILSKLYLTGEIKSY